MISGSSRDSFAALENASFASENFSKAMFKMDRKSKINKALIERCVEKGLVDGNFLRQSLDMEMMNLARRIFDESDSQSNGDEEAVDEVNDEKDIVLGFGSNDNSQLAPASAGNPIRQPIEIAGIGDVKESDLILFFLIFLHIVLMPM